MLSKIIAAALVLTTLQAFAAQPKHKAAPAAQLCPVQIQSTTVQVDCGTVLIIAQLQAQITYLTDHKVDKQLDTTRALAPKNNRGGRA